MGYTTEIKRLVEKFEEHKDSYKSGKYNEAQLRQEFLDPFFAALGWDMDNEHGYAEAYKEVVHEDAVKVGGATKAPDYSFRIGGVRKFFVEAKKPSINIKEDISPAYQLRRYAWSAKLPISILTDFEEFAVYDCRKTPKPNDKASTGRIFYTTYDKFLEQWDEIEGIFSREAILKGAFDKYADSKKPRGTAEVDDEFLREMESWRESLAKNIAFKNSGLSIRELNHAVQLIIDRIVFLRICEDRGIESYGKLQALLNGKNVYERLMQIFMQADDKYNSGLFHFTREKNRPGEPDSLTPSLEITDSKLKDIIRRLYYPESPYEFSVLSGDILGQVYERFLGKVIVPKGRGVDIEEKPEVRKAGGVYYTPTYIVDYIVKNTVGKLVEGATPKKVEKLRVLDPACGSGSFLLGAYQYLLDWHRDWYASNDPEKHAKGKQPKIFQFGQNDWRLTTSEKKRILLNNIYGVDIDTQAVEVTKLSLLLKVLEGESEETLLKQFQLFKERALPDLRANIKCGNSLIGPDFYEGKELSLFDEDEQYRINVFDWEREFKDVMKAGGFDAVIGNPPYVDVKSITGNIKNELSRRYISATKRFDLYIPFIEKSLHLLSRLGLLGFIVPSMFMKREYGVDLRKVINEMSSILNIVDFGTNQIFKGPLNYVSVICLKKGKHLKSSSIIAFNETGFKGSEIKEALSASEFQGVKYFEMESSNLETDKEWQLLPEKESEFLRNMFLKFESMDNILQFACEGIHSGKDEVFFVSTEKVKTLELETPPTYPLAKGKDVHRYDYINKSKLDNQVIYPYDVKTATVLSSKRIEEQAPNVWQYLLESRTKLKGRSYFDRSNKEWYELWCPRVPEVFMKHKIVGPEIAVRGEFTIVRNSLFINNKLKAIVLKDNIGESLEYLLGLINSKLLVFLHRTIAPPKGNNYFEVKTRIFGRLPIYRINFDDGSDVKKHDRMVELVETMLDLNKKLPEAMTDHNKNLIQRQIDYTDSEIDKLVYVLYDLTEEEIKIVEG